MEIPVVVYAEAPFKEGLLIEARDDLGLVVLEDGSFEWVEFRELRAHWTYDAENKLWRSDVTTEEALIGALEEENRTLTEQIEAMYANARELEEPEVPETAESEESDSW